MRGPYQGPLVIPSWTVRRTGGWSPAPEVGKPEPMTDADTTRPVEHWRNQHRDWDIDDDFIIRPFAGDWAYEPGCGCDKCEVVTYGSVRRADR